MQANALRRVHRLFTWTKITDAIAEVYDNVYEKWPEKVKSSKTLAPVYQLKTGKLSWGGTQ